MGQLLNNFLKLMILAASFFVFSQSHARELDKLYEKAKFRIGKHEFTAYIADDEQKRAQGLMFIEKMDQDTGMLFVFEEEKPLGFWMKNTLIPLNIGFFDAQGVLVDVQEMQVASSLMAVDVPTYQSASPAMYALEMNRGWFTKNKINPGTHKGIKLEMIGPSKSKMLRGKLKPTKAAGH